jgi:hypothetical protein
MSKFVKFLLVFSLSVLFSAVSAENFKGSVSFVAPGTPVQAVLTETLSSEFTRAGETIALQLSAPVYSGSAMVVPAGSVVEAEVISVNPAGRAGEPGKIDFRLKTLITPNGARIPISASIDQNRFSLVAEEHARAKHFAKTTVAGAAGGALSGLIGGAISGGKIGKGAALGTAIGSGVGLVGGAIQKGKEIVLPKGTQIPFVLDQVLRIASPATSSQYADPSQTYPAGAFQDPGVIYQQQNQNPYY